MPSLSVPGTTYRCATPCVSRDPVVHLYSAEWSELYPFAPGRVPGTGTM